MKALIALSALGILTLLSEIFSFKKIMYPLTLAGIILTGALAVMEWHINPADYGLFNNMLHFDHFAVAFTTLLCAISFLWFWMARDFFADQTSVTDHLTLAVFALAGGVILVSYNNFTMLFLGVEILSIPMYVMAGSSKANISSNESAFKYFLMGAFASGFLLFGIALVYGSTGTFDLDKVSSSLTGPVAGSGILLTGMLLMLVGLAFKVSAVPFHFWAPDVYQGAPAPVTAFMATIVKISAMAAFYRLFATTFSSLHGQWVTVLSVIAAVTMLAGNISAVYQSSVKRMLAYSSIAHAGYMLLALVAMNQFAANSVWFYSASYAIATIAAFTVLQLVLSKTNDDSISSFNGLGKSNPLLAVAVALSMLSLAGIPPTAGFFAKFSIFKAALYGGHTWLVCIAVIASLIGVYFYFKLIIAMFFAPADEAVSLDVKQTHRLLLLVCMALTVILGLFPDMLINIIN